MQRNGKKIKAMSIQSKLSKAQNFLGVAAELTEDGQHYEIRRRDGEPLIYNITI